MPTTDIHILKALLESNQEFVSGNSLATELGISRVGVWARLEKLRDEDFSVEAIRHRGYRLLQQPPRINDRLLRAYMEIQGCRTKTLFLPEVDSTNSEAERQLASGLDAPFVVISSRQTRGRGRLGRVWHSPDDGNIYASFAFRPNLPPMRLRTITLWLGLTVCHLLQEHYNIDASLKWPNDLLIEGKKVAGMLTEARIDADRTRDLIFGIGLNINGDTRSWPPEIARVATSLTAHAKEKILINQIGAHIIGTLIRAYDRFLDGSYEKEFHPLWNQYDGLKDRVISAEIEGQRRQGIAKGIDADGNLRLQIPNSQEEILLHSGEVSLGTESIAGN